MLGRSAGGMGPRRPLTGRRAMQARLQGGGAVGSRGAMSQTADPLTPETLLVDTPRVRCDGASDIRSGQGFRSAALGHPLVWLAIDEKGFVDCGYCDRRFVLQGGPADHGSENGVIPAGTPTVPTIESDASPSTTGAAPLSHDGRN